MSWQTSTGNTRLARSGGMAAGISGQLAHDSCYSNTAVLTLVPYIKLYQQAGGAIPHRVHWRPCARGRPLYFRDLEYRSEAPMASPVIMKPFSLHSMHAWWVSLAA